MTMRDQPFVPPLRVLTLAWRLAGRGAMAAWLLLAQPACTYHPAGAPDEKLTSAAEAKPVPESAAGGAELESQGPPPSRLEKPETARSAALDDPRPLRQAYHDLRRHTPRSIGEDAGLDISPDGAAVVFASTSNSNQPKIYLKDENSPLVRAVTTGESRDLQPKFSPDGKSIAFASDREGNFDIWMVRVAQPNSLEQITSSPEDELHPTFSPDGRQIAFCRRSGKQGWNLWVEQRDRQSQIELGPGLFPEWSPTGEWIAFQRASERGERWFAVWIIRPDGSDVRQVVAFDHWGAIQPTWSLDGSQLAFTTTARLPDLPAGTDLAGRGVKGDDLWIIELRQGRTFQLTHHEGANWKPVWGLNGRLYFVSDRYGSPNILSLVPPEVEE
ncbi:MAG: PD40 domain-containing protein [Planctomycetes bacterium]|nr:PD40 domain-containing protein [Planctomycetota bacterium]